MSEAIEIGIDKITIFGSVRSSGGQNVFVCLSIHLDQVCLELYIYNCENKTWLFLDYRLLETHRYNLGGLWKIQEIVNLIETETLKLGPTARKIQ